MCWAAATWQKCHVTRSFEAADPSLGQKKSGSVVLVHGLMNEAEDGVDTYSLDFAHPLSPIVAFGAVLAAQAWQ